MKFVDIVSRFGDVTLRVTPVRHPWDTNSHAARLGLQLTGPDLDCSSVYVEDPEAPQTLVEFGGLADDHKGWDGEKTWASAGGDAKLRANHDQINTTRLDVTLTGGVVPRWSAFAELARRPVPLRPRLQEPRAVNGDCCTARTRRRAAAPERRNPRELRPSRSSGRDAGTAQSRSPARRRRAWPPPAAARSRCAAARARAAAAATSSSCRAAPSRPGTSTSRTSVASTAIATAMPRPSCWIDGTPVRDEDREDGDHDQRGAGDRARARRQALGDRAARVAASRRSARGCGVSRKTS